MTNVYSQDSSVLDAPDSLRPAGPDTDISPGQVVDDFNAVSAQVEMSIQADPVPIKEFVLLMDNSSSMEEIDPDRQILNVVSDFIIQQDQTSYFSLMSFDQDVNVILPLTPNEIINLDLLKEGRQPLGYEGVTNDINRAVERAVYELKYNGLEGVDKNIILLTDGFGSEADSETSNPVMLATSTVADIADLGIRVSAIVFSQETLLPEIQILGTQLAIENYSISDISGLGQTLQLTSPVIEEPGIQVDVNMQTVFPTATVIEQAPALQASSDLPARAVQANLGDEERMRSVIIMVAAIILIITMGALILLLFVRGRKITKAGSVTATEAFLVDINGYTGHQQFLLGKKATMLGRVAGKDTINMDYIVIPESTIGRRHAVIEYKDYAYWILDQGSINGTFVNNIPVTSEIRLKHGDILRLHKFEFEFSIPELDDAGKTKISDTFMAGHDIASESGQQAEIEMLKGGQFGQGFELDVDFSEAESESSAVEEAESSESKKPLKSDEETLLPGHDLDASDTIDGSDETLMPDFRSISSSDSENQDAAPAKNSIDEQADADAESLMPDSSTPVSEPDNEGAPPDNASDETLMPGLFGDEDDDSTLRPNRDTSLDDIIERTDSDDEK